MEPKFKTSFIPKESLVEKVPTGATHQPSRAPRSLAIVFSFIVLLIALAVGGAIFVYSSFLQSSIASKSESLQRAREAFQPALIQELERLDARIESAEELLANHVAPSSMFALLGATTLKTVRFTNLSYSVVENSVVNFDAVALQSDVFGSNRFIHNPIISELAAGEGGITFRVTATIEPRFLAYVNTITEDDDFEVTEGFTEE